MKKTLLTLFLMPAMCMAQTMDKLPENPQPGKCYVKCVTPDLYKNESVTVVTKPASTKLIVVPAEYKTVTETIVLKPASKRLIYVPAKYKTVTEEIEVVQSSSIISVVPAKFSGSSQKIEVEPAYSKWEMGDKNPECKSDDPNDCRVWCFREYPAQFQTVPTSELVKDASFTKNPTNSKKRTVRKQVEISPATTREVRIPAKTTTITKRVLVKDSYVKEKKIPAETKQVKKEVLVKKGGLTVWEEIECELKNYNLLPILYPLGSSVLTSTAKKIIDNKIWSLMRDKPFISIEISSHTDSRGSASANQQLSEARARSVVNYLIARGINSSRLVAKGYGEERLMNRCADGVTCTEKEHERNRRTEFRVLSSY